MNFKLAIVSSLCFPISWVHSLPQRAIQRQQGGEAGAVLVPPWCPGSPTAPGCALLHPHCSSWRMFVFQQFVLICICGSISQTPSVPQGAAAVLCMDWELGRTWELPGMVQILHVEGWKLIQGGWEEKNDQTEMLGSL